jgi:hypothetical protein
MITFQRGSRLRELGNGAFFYRVQLAAFTILSSVEIIGDECFERCVNVRRITFEDNSRLKRIVIPASVETIENLAFCECGGLEVCLIDEKSVLVRIGEEVFGGRISLRSFHIASGVMAIGHNCVRKCILLRRFRFGSLDSLKAFVGDLTQDEALENLGLSALSSVFKIKVHDTGPDLNF